MSAGQEAGAQRRVIRWSELGAPTAPGTYRVPGLGDVRVIRADIKRAAEMGGDPLVKVVLSRSFQHPETVFVLGCFTGFTRALHYFSMTFPPAARRLLASASH